MANILDFIKWRGDIPFQNLPVGEVDALILSYLSYMCYEGLVGEDVLGEGVRVADAAGALLEREERARNSMSYSLKDDAKLLALLVSSERFGEARLVGYVNRVDQETEKQFSAVTLLLGDGTAFISFRGTDNTVVGWKEDFNMSFETAVPAQLEAVAYLRHVSAQIDRPLILGGHSKGGNLAAYAGMFVQDEVRERIVEVYNFDGPGFNETVTASPAFSRVDMRIHTFVPHSSMIGILLWHHEPFTVVRSDGMGVFQHNAYTWQVMGGRFVTVSARTSNSHFADDTLKRWLRSLTPQMRRQTIDSIYALLNVSDGQRVGELFDARSVLGIVRSAGSMDEATRNALLESFRLLGDALVEAVPGWIDRTASDIRHRVTGDRRALEAPADEQEPGAQPEAEAPAEEQEEKTREDA